MAENLSGTEVPRQAGYTAVQVSRIRRRFCDDHLAGLEDRARSGRPPTVIGRTAARIVALTLKPAGAGVTHWSTRDLAEYVGRVSPHDGASGVARPRVTTAPRG